MIRLIFGLENGLVVVDYLSQFVLMNLATADLYGTMDPFQRATSSPKRRGPNSDSALDDSGVFSYDQVNFVVVVSLSLTLRKTIDSTAFTTTQLKLFTRSIDHLLL